MLRDNWDGIDRRDGYDRRTSWDGIDRRRSIRYEERRMDDIDGPVIERERIIEVSQKPEQTPSSPKWLSPGITMPIIFSVITAIGGFIFNLYDKITALEYKETTIFEKITDIKTVDTELRTLIKDQEKVNQRMADHISSVEETVMELYRQKKQK